jgi:hypothetical protein
MEQQGPRMEQRGWSNKEWPHQQTRRGEGTRCSCQSGAGAQSGARAGIGSGNYKDSGAEQVQGTERSRSRSTCGFRAAGEEQGGNGEAHNGLGVAKAAKGGDDGRGEGLE